MWNEISLNTGFSWLIQIWLIYIRENMDNSKFQFLNGIFSNKSMLISSVNLNMVNLKKQLIQCISRCVNLKYF